jgi:hypothetical protein
MKVILVVSPATQELESVQTAIRVSNYEITEIVCTHEGPFSKGAPLFGYHVPCRYFSIQDRADPSAEAKRNARMAEYAEALIAVWDGKCRYAKHMIDTMRARGKLVTVFRVSAEQKAAHPSKV